MTVWYEFMLSMNESPHTNLAVQHHRDTFK